VLLANEVDSLLVLALKLLLQRLQLLLSVQAALFQLLILEGKMTILINLISNISSVTVR
jgi:hypothetical protein